MSHYCVFVLVEEAPTDSKHAEELCEPYLEPFSERKKVPSYSKECYCVGQEASIACMKQATSELGQIGDIRDQYWNEANQKAEEILGKKLADLSYAEKKSFWPLREKAAEELKPSWEERINPIFARRDELLALHPLKAAASQECDSCQGTGFYDSDYNPESKWDWWVVGGRWTGYLTPEYDPCKDPANLETCYLCRGTGKRDDDLGKKYRQEDPSYTCNGCDGHGVSVKFSSHWVEPPKGGNYRKVSELVQLIQAGEKISPFAILTPDTGWHEKGKMGWWGIVTDARDAWKEEALRILKDYPNHWAVVIDCHI